MTKENKELLLKDLCARLPYGLFVEDEKASENPVIYTHYYHPNIESCKPYLRPLTDITDDEIMERLVSQYGKRSDEVDGFIEFKKHAYDTQCIVDVKFARYKGTEDETRYFTLFSIDSHNTSYDTID